MKMTAEAINNKLGDSVRISRETFLSSEEQIRNSNSHLLGFQVNHTHSEQTQGA